MPNALDDAMMMSYNWNKGMDERLKKIRETFTPAEIDEGIEYMNSQSAARRAVKEMPPEKKERMVALAKENEERFQLINNLRRRYSIEELKDATEYLNWCREEAKKKPDVSKEDEEIANSILQMQDAIENALKTGDPETAIRLKNRLYDIQKILAREEISLFMAGFTRGLAWGLFKAGQKMADAMRSGPGWPDDDDIPF